MGLFIDSSATTTIQAQSNPNLILTKLADKTSVSLNETLTYTISYQNPASDPVNNLVITDVVPAQLELMAVSNGGLINGQTVTWTVPTVPAGSLPENLTIQTRASDPSLPRLPTVDIKANNSDGPLTVTAGDSAVLSWLSINTTACTASDAWTGDQPLSGSVTIRNIRNTKTYTLTCVNATDSAQDSVTINVAKKK